MLRSLIFAVVVGLVAASPMGPSGGMGMEPFADEHSPLSGSAAEELMKLAREVVGEGQEECDNEEEVYKWYPPLPCRVENSTYDTLAQRMCPEDGQCNVGPVDTTLNTSSVRVFFCSRPGKYMLYQACRVQNAETGEQREASQCFSPNGEAVGCTVGPFSVLSNRTNYIAYYCDTTMMDSLQKVAARGIVSQACRVENQYGDDLLKRMCPPGYRCNNGPMEGKMNDMPVQAYLCKEAEMEWEWSLSETVHFLVVEKQVDPFIILMVMRNLQDHGISITPKVVYDLVLEQVKAHMQEMAKEREEQDKQDPKENIEDIMHMLEHRRLLNMQAELRRKMFEEKNMDKEGKGDNVEELMHILHHVSLMAMEEKISGKQDDDSSMAAELLKGMMGQKMGQEEKNDDDMGLEDLLKHMMGQKKEEMSEEARIKLTLRRASFVRAVIAKVKEVGEKDGDDDMKMMLLLKGVHDLLEENKDIMEGQSGEVRVVKVMKAIKYVKSEFAGADKEEDRDVNWMVVIAKQALMREKEAAAEEEERQMKQLLEMLKDKKEDEEENDPMKMLMKMMKKKMEDEEEDNDPMKMLMKMMMKKKMEDEEEDNDPMKMLMKMMMKMKGEEEEEEKDPMKMLMMMMMKMKGEEEEEDNDPMKMLMMMMKKMKGEEQEEEKDPMKMLMMMMKKMKGEEEEKDPLKMLLAHLMGEKMPEEQEKGDMLKEIMSALKELMEKKNGDDDEGAQLMAFVKAMMGGEGTVQDALHWLHHMHAIKMEAEIREKYEEMSKQRESESKAQELLQFLHSTMQQRQMGYSMPQMAGRW